MIFPKIEKDSFLLAAELATEIRKYLDRALDIIVIDEANFDKHSRETWHWNTSSSLRELPYNAHRNSGVGRIC